MKHYASTIDGSYIGSYGDDVPAPENSIDTGSAPAYNVQAWNGYGWVPWMDPNPDPVGFNIQLAYMIAQRQMPWQLLQFFFCFQWQGTAENVSLDFLRAYLFRAMAAYETSVATWFTPDVQATLVALGRAHGIPFDAA